MMSNQPIIVLKEGTERSQGRDARKSNITAAITVADIVRTTLGPKGMDKMLVDSLGDITITNDGATILKEMDIEHPAAKMLVEVAKTQENECGDGTTTAVILAGEMLKKAETMVAQNVHPTLIAKGYTLAHAKAIEILDKSARKVNIKDTKTLEAIAQTAMISKSVSNKRELLAKITVEAVKSVVEDRNGRYVFDKDNILVTKKQGGSIEDTELINGIIVDKERVHTGMPNTVKNAKIALLDEALEVKKTEVDAKIQITNPSQLQKFLEEEEKNLKSKVDVIVNPGPTWYFAKRAWMTLYSTFWQRRASMPQGA